MAATTDLREEPFGPFDASKHPRGLHGLFSKKGGGLFTSGEHIPTYSGKELTFGGAAGGSNGARFAFHKNGSRWLIKHYGGNRDRVATELAANAIYREVGARVPIAGKLRLNDGRTALAYPTLPGSPSPHVFDLGPSKALGRHFMTDALLANWDVAGLEDDNVLWDEEGRPFRVDQGGTLEFRAMGGSKDFGPVPMEVRTMLSPGGQGHRSMDVTDDSLRRQALEIHGKLSPEKIDGIVAQAGFADRQMAKRVAANLKARVDWMGRFGRGEVEAPPLKEDGFDFSDGALSEAWHHFPLHVFDWNELLHPRDEHGRFRETLRDRIDEGHRVQLGKVEVGRDKKDGLYIVRSKGAVRKFADLGDAGRAALDMSARAKGGPNDVGGETKHKDYNAYLASRGVNPMEPGTFDGLAGLTPTAIFDELAAAQTRLSDAQTHPLQAVRNGIPYIRARVDELKAKTHAEVGHLGSTPQGSTPTGAAALEKLKSIGYGPGAKFKMGNLDTVYSVYKQEYHDGLVISGSDGKSSNVAPEAFLGQVSNHSNWTLVTPSDHAGPGAAKPPVVSGIPASLIAENLNKWNGNGTKYVHYSTGHTAKVTFELGGGKPPYQVSYLGASLGYSTHDETADALTKMGKVVAVTDTPENPEAAHNEPQNLDLALAQILSELHPGEEWPLGNGITVKKQQNGSLAVLTSGSPGIPGTVAGVHPTSLAAATQALELSKRALPKTWAPNPGGDLPPVGAIFSNESGSAVFRSKGIDEQTGKFVGEVLKHDLPEKPPGSSVSWTHEQAAMFSKNGWVSAEAPASYGHDLKVGDKVQGSQPEPYTVTSVSPTGAVTMTGGTGQPIAADSVVAALSNGGWTKIEPPKLSMAQQEILDTFPVGSHVKMPSGHTVEMIGPSGHAFSIDVKYLDGTDAGSVASIANDTFVHHINKGLATPVDAPKSSAFENPNATQLKGDLEGLAFNDAQMLKNGTKIVKGAVSWTVISPTGSKQTYPSAEMAAVQALNRDQEADGPVTSFADAKIGDVFHNTSTKTEFKIVGDGGDHWKVQATSYPDAPVVGIEKGTEPNAMLKMGALLAPTSKQAPLSHDEIATKIGPEWPGSYPLYLKFADGSTGKLTWSTANSASVYNLEKDGGSIDLAAGAPSDVSVPEYVAKNLASADVGVVAISDSAVEAGPAKPGKPIKGMQENATKLKDLDLSPGDVVQYKKGGWKYTLVEQQPNGGWKVQAANGTTKVYSGHKAPMFIQKADGSKLAAKTSGGTPLKDVEAYSADVKAGDVLVKTGAGPSGGAIFLAKADSPPGEQVQVEHIGGTPSGIANMGGTADIYPGGVGAPAGAPVKKPKTATELKAQLKTPYDSTPPMSALPTGTVIATPAGQVGVLKPGDPASAGYVAAYDVSTGVKFEPPAGKQPTMLSTDPEVMADAAAAVAAAQTATNVTMAPGTAQEPSGPPASFSNALTLHSASEHLHAAQSEADLTYDQRQAVASYVGGSQSINSGLRSSTSVMTADVAKAAKNMDLAMSARISKPTVIVRKTTLQAWVDAKPGHVIQDNGFFSASWSPTVISTGGVYGGSEAAIELHVLMKPGDHFVYPNAFGEGLTGEQEVILPRGSLFKVVKSEKHDMVTRLYVETF